MSKLINATCAALILLSCGCSNSNQAARDHDDAQCVAAAAAGNKPGKLSVNTVCPVVPADAVDESVTVLYKGKTIAFCCGGCVKDFNAMDEKGKDGILKAAMTYAK
ncbi:MAG: hypothetical protein AABZ53_13980 [Planctomycetota bacterium]